MVSNKRVNRFLEATKSYVLYEKDTLDQIEKLFYEVMEENKKKFEEFKNVLPQLKGDLKKDLQFFMQSDPAANSEQEILLAYPGYKAISSYRIAHEINKLGFKLQARMITEEAHSKTGIDIHPGAQLDVPLFIDHGTGVVIGETAIGGKNLKIYQGVTLGALSLREGYKLKGTKRHPTIGENVVIYSNASILGDITVGDNVTIGSNVFITEPIPSNVKVALSKPSLTIKEK